MGNFRSGALMRHLLPLLAVLAISCEQTLQNNDEPGVEPQFSKSDVARILSELPLRHEHLAEVYDAVSSSSGGGYDEEYMMSDLFTSPGSGVGGSGAAKSSAYANPIRNLFFDYFNGTKAGGPDAAACVRALTGSDMQIYWPYSEDWDGSSSPIITVDPGYGAESNVGYEMRYDEGGLHLADSVLVTEEVARSRPVWVINSNVDAEFTPFLDAPAVRASSQAEAGGEEDCPALKLKTFKMLRNYDSWFCGASEFLIQCGSVDGFKAASESDLKLYRPSVTEFMLVVKRSQCGRVIPVNGLMISELTPQMENIAFLVTEDDGGTTTSWKCSATVKYESKSYGFDINLPYNDKDDIVWRGQLAASYFKGKMVMGRFGDVEITFALE